MADKMELDYIAKRDNLELDIDYYMKGGLNSILARFIMYHKLFDIDIEISTFDNRELLI